jgi:hypothetical protein
MRHFAFALVLGCGGASPSAPSGPTTPQAPPSPPIAPPPAPADRGPPTSASDPLSYCRLAVHLIDELSTCRNTTDGFASMRAQYADFATHQRELARKSGALCATFVEGVIEDPVVEDCVFSVRDRRAEVTAFLDAYYAERVKIDPTGHAGADAVLAGIAKHRDAVCACSDEPCTRALDKSETWLAKPLPEDAPVKARDLAGLLIDDVSKCSGDIRWARPKRSK